jgi:phosphomannomutase
MISSKVITYAQYYGVKDMPTQDLHSLIMQAQNWSRYESRPEYKLLIQDMIAQQDFNRLQDHFAKRLNFGTAGLRGALGPGPNRMNSVLIRRVSLALGIYLKQQIPTMSSDACIVIGYDARHGSWEFTQTAAQALAGLGYKIYITSEPCPTPLLAYSMVHLKAVAGIMVTASHNPPQDNGFKVYWGNGAQIIPPHDQGISACIDQVGAGDAYQDIMWSTLIESDQFAWVADEIGEAYLQAQLSARISSGYEDQLKVTYTAMHGVGYKWYEKVMRAAGYQHLSIVAEQVHPDPDFPTVSFPNPEEKGALDLAKVVAQRNQAHVLLAHDPDADRLAVVAPNTDGDYRIFTGDQVGALMAHEIFERLGKTSTQLPIGINPLSANDMMASSLVSSRLLSQMAQVQGIQYAETLTGFKWIANRALSHTDLGGRFLLGYEEAIGYSVYGIVHDKDGVSAALFMADMAARALSEGKTLWDRLDEVYQRYGLALSTQRSRVKPGLEGAQQIQAWMHKLQTQAPSNIAGITVEQFDDLNQFDPPLQGNVLRFMLADQSRIIARPSGTEPKIKFYYEVNEALRDEVHAVAAAEDRANIRLQSLIEGFEAYVDQE